MSMMSSISDPSDETTGGSADRSGLDCVRSICLYFEKTVDADWLRKEFSSDSHGFDINSVINSLIYLGFDITTKSTNQKELRKAAFPAIVEIANGKFALIGKVVDEIAYIQVPGEATSKKIQVAELSQKIRGKWISIAQNKSNWGGEKFGLGWLIKALLRYKGLLAETLAASFALQIFALTTPLAFQIVIDKVLVHKGLSTLDVVIAGLAAASLFEVVLTALRTYVLTHTTHRIDAELGAKIFKHLMALPMSFFATRKVGEVVARAREMDTVRSFFTGTGLTIAVDLFFTVFFLSVMAYYSHLLTVIVIVSLPLFLGISMVLIPLLNHHLEDRFAKAAENQAFLVESISGVETLKSMAAESRFQRQWEERLSGYVRSSFKTGHLANLTQQGTQLISKFLNLILLWLGAKLALAGELTIGQLIAFNMLSARVNAPILRLSTLWQEFQQMRVSLRRIGDLLDTPTEVPPNASNSLIKFNGEIRFDNVSFKYKEDASEILSQFSLHIKSGELVGIVGSSGSGKSTMAKLLLRLYVPSRGRIFLDDSDISGLNPNLIRRQIAVVTQDVMLFSRSVRENISIGQIDADMQDILNAANLADADEFIRKLPRGYDTILGERGSNLSGGQRQRIAIARALLLNPRILILDEATSMLDADTEMRFWSNIRQISSGRTVLAITHRLSTVLEMDRIVVIEDGKIIEQGSPQALLQIKGRFRHLYDLQKGPPDWARGGQ
jgi:ATP-binding cassette, subfamily B, bacterial HlyB/CyaB